MIEKLKYLLAGSLMLAAAGSFVACDDDDAAVDEWNATYVYLERPALAVDMVNCTVTHDENGLSGWEGRQPVTVRLSKACGTDVTVRLSLEVTGSEEGMAASFSFENDGLVVIPAGETSVQAVLQADLNALAGICGKKGAVASVEVNLASVTPSRDDLRVSSHQNSLTVEVMKTKYPNVIVDQEPAGAPMDRSGWTVSCSSTNSEDAADFEVTSNLTDDNAYTYMYLYNYIGIQIDLGGVHEVTGIENYVAYGAYYAHSSCRIYSSVDGKYWFPEDARKDITADATQYVSFVEPVKARYLRWRMWGGNVLSSEIYVWSAE